MKKVILLILLLLITPIVGADAFDDNHPGRFCQACHSIRPCTDACHMDEGTPGYIGVHVDQKICGRCHGDKVTESDLHSIHGGKKEMCEACHSPKGWNSSIVKIAPVETKNLVVRPNKNCVSCHSISGEKRLHGIHKAFLTEENCAKCHGDMAITRAEIIRITGRKPGASQNADGINAATQEVKEVVMAPVNILTDLFNSISNIWMEILS